MQNLKRSEKGQGLVEYIFLICLVSVFLFTVIQRMARTTRTAYQNADSKIAQLPS